MKDELSERLIALRDHFLRLEDEVCSRSDVPEEMAVQFGSLAHQLEVTVDVLLLVIREEPPPQEEVAPPVIASQVYDKERSVVCCSNCRATLFQVKTSQPRPFHFEDEP